MYLLAAAISLIVLPNPTLTPGITRPITVQQVCSTRWGLDRRHVTRKMKRKVAKEYHVPWKEHRFYEFDHLIPRELGGADDVRNLWPQSWASAHRKDLLENWLHHRVCTGTMDLHAAQAVIAKDWIKAYRELYLPWKSHRKHREHRSRAKAPSG